MTTAFPIIAEPEDLDQGMAEPGPSGRQSVEEEIYDAAFAQTLYVISTPPIHTRPHQSTENNDTIVGMPAKNLKQTIRSPRLRLPRPQNRRLPA